MRKNRITKKADERFSSVEQRLIENGYDILDIVPLMSNVDITGLLVQTDFTGEDRLGRKLQSCVVFEVEHSPILIGVSQHWFNATQIEEGKPIGFHRDIYFNFTPHISSACIISGKAGGLVAITVDISTSELIIWMQKYGIPEMPAAEATEAPPQQAASDTEGSASATDGDLVAPPTTEDSDASINETVQDGVADTAPEPSPNDEGQRPAKEQLLVAEMDEIPQ